MLAGCVLEGLGFDACGCMSDGFGMLLGVN